MRPPKPKDPHRSALMARVRQKRTSPEKIVGTLLKSIGQFYRLNVRDLSGSPDFANRSRKWALFVNGCYWHHHTNCRRATVPKTNEAFWRDKFGANRARDARSVRVLRHAKFHVVIVWECETADPEELRERLQRSLNRVA
jgi:DNA mismatch endonuclease, patch repair protein